MPGTSVNGVTIYYEVHGSGFPLVWSHEFGGAHDSWTPQIKHFERGYQVIVYNNRGYPPSGVPHGDEHYSQDRLVEDLHGLLEHLGLSRAFVGGLSMGGNVALNFGLRYPDKCAGLIVAGAGTGSTNPTRFAAETAALAERLEREGIEGWAGEYAEGPTRIQFKRKNPEGWRVFRDSLLKHSADGSARIIRNVQGKRPSVFSLEDGLRNLQVPTLIIAGDEDDPCVEPSVFMKRTIPNSGLVFFPQTGHTVNLEDPDRFNREVEGFLSAVEAGRWATREYGSGVGFLADEAAYG